MKMKIGLATALAAAAAAVAATAALAVVGGTPDAAHAYVGIVGDHVNHQLCSGVLVGPTTLLTAAHCVGEGDPVVVDFAENGLASLGGPGTVTGTAHPDPAWASGNGIANFDRNDLAVVVLDEAQPGPYAALPGLNASATLPNNQAVTLVGYGVSDAKDISTFGVRRSGSAKVIPGAGVAGESFLKISSNRSATCFGDSGGPVLVGDTAYALNAYGVNAGCTSTAYAQRLDTAHARAFVDLYLQ